jgi:hypothetical protein
MKSILGILGLVIVLAIAYQMNTSSLDQATAISPKRQIDFVGIQSDLRSLAQAERIYFASNGAYAALDPLQQSGGVQFQGPNHRGYSFSIEIDGLKHFQITAKPIDSAQTDWPTYSIDETQQILILRNVAR